MYAFNSWDAELAETPYLMLNGCQFEYFIGDHEALIYVETNNIYTTNFIDAANEGISTVSYGFTGQDRGAIIRLENTVV